MSPNDSSSSVAAVVLAAGASTRMGQPKQIISWDGEPLLVRVLRRVLESRVNPVIVVLGYMAEQIQPILEPLAATGSSPGAAEAVAGEAEMPPKATPTPGAPGVDPAQDSQPPRVRFIINPKYQEGQSSSMKAGLAALPPEATAVIFILGDQPFVGKTNVDTLVRLYEALRNQRGLMAERSIIIPVHQGKRGNPVLFGRGFFKELLNIEGDEGGRSLIFSHPWAVVTTPAGPEVLLDIDTWDDYQRRND